MILVQDLFCIEVLGIECRLYSYLEGINFVVFHAQPFSSYLSIELGGEVNGEIWIYLNVVFCQRILRILGRKDDEISVTESDTLLEEIDPSVIYS
ncbi:MAG: hypothetical protein WCJ45_06070 [bacterium]